MRMLAIYHKTDRARFVSHLDILRTLHRAFRRAGLPLKYSEGFNPHPELSFASALATGMTSDAEYFEVELAEEMDPQQFTERVNRVLPEGLFLSGAVETPAGIKTLAAATRGAEYLIRFYPEEMVAEDTVRETAACFLTEDIFVNKRTKSGIKPVNLRSQILKVTVDGIEKDSFSLRVLGRLQSDGGLRAELFAGALLDRLDAHGFARIHRTGMFFDSDGSLPRLPQG